MITADFIAIGVIILFALIGISSGFGRGLKFFTSGIFGKIISVIVCYFLFGLVLELDFVQGWLEKFVVFLAEKNNFICNVLLKLRIDLIAFAVVLFVIVQIARKILVAILCGIFESEVLLMQILNKILGLVLYLFMLCILVLIVFQVISLIGGNVAQSVANYFAGSKLSLDKLFLDNPLLSIIETITLPAKI